MHACTDEPISAEIGQPAGRKTLHRCTTTRLIRESKRRFTAIHTTVCFRRRDTGGSKSATRRCHLTPPPRRTCLLPCTNQHLLFPPLLERQRGGLRQRSRVLEKTSHLAVLEAVLNERSTNNTTKMRTRFGRDKEGRGDSEKEQSRPQNEHEVDNIYCKFYLLEDQGGLRCAERGQQRTCPPDACGPEGGRGVVDVADLQRSVDNSRTLLNMETLMSTHIVIL